MPGGLMNLIFESQQNCWLNGNPTRSFFKSTYSKYTNFGLQKFRNDFDGSKFLRLNEQSTFDFKIGRYGDLLMETYIGITLPNIWSGILPPNENIEPLNTTEWRPYEFKWIDNIGSKMITKVTVYCGNQEIIQYSGDYLLAQVQRDFTETKKYLFDEMTGNVPELNDPANYGLNNGKYPNSFFIKDDYVPQPSIQGRILYIPLNNWFSMKSQLAFPLISLQYNELHVSVTFRPISELFVIRDINDPVNNYPYISPNFNDPDMRLARFIQPPPNYTQESSAYLDKTSWNTDLHLISTYCFLSDDERRLFASNEQNYLVRQVYEQIFYNVTGAQKIDLNSNGMVPSWMFYYQRSDANTRNQWSNYTNFPYDYPPNYITPSPNTVEIDGETYDGPGMSSSNLYCTIVTSIDNVKNILLNMSVLLDGSYRENTQSSGIFNYIGKYIQTPGAAPDGLYVYNFCLDTGPYLQPSGAINMSHFHDIQLEFNTILPPPNYLAQSTAICDPDTKQIIGINKSSWNIYQYNYDLHFFEERYNILTFQSGNAGMKWAY
jgi:hypothetical protein